MAASRKKKEKREKRRTEAAERGECPRFDVPGLLGETNFETKPNMAKFLEGHVKDIRAYTEGRLQFYPSFGYSTRKLFVRFLDGHELIWFVQTDFPGQDRYYLEDGADQVPLDEKELPLVEKFFERLCSLGFAKV